MITTLQYVFDALSLGSLYALSALGIALIFGVMRLVNFAYGDVITFCCYSLIWPTTGSVVKMALGGLPAPLLVLAVILTAAALSMVLEILVFRQLRHANAATTMIAAFSVGYVITNLLMIFYSSRPKSVDLWPQLNEPLTVMGVRVAMLQLVTIGTALSVLAGLVVLLRYTRIGLEMRAAAEDFTMARMLGVRANRVILMAFGLSGALAGIVGLLMLTKTGVVDLSIGAPVMLTAFVATVIGGLGSLSGAVLAGFLLGMVNTLLQAWLPVEARPFRDAFLYLAVIIFLVWRPAGLFVTSASTQRV